MNYTGAITDIAKSHNLTSFDFIFIDGRWRACCAARAYPYLREDSVLLIHDYVNRKWHHKVEAFYERIGQCYTSAIFRKRQNITDEDLDRFVDKHIHDFN
eukprot:Selendium_serpulae@DN6306_c1_g1_i3.p1